MILEIRQSLKSRIIVDFVEIQEVAEINPIVIIFCLDVEIGFKLLPKILAMKKSRIYKSARLQES